MGRYYSEEKLKQSIKDIKFIIRENGYGMTYYELQKCKKRISKYYLYVKELEEKYQKLQERYQELLQVNHDLIEKNYKVKEKINSVRIYGLRSGKTLIATLLNDILDILEGSDTNE